MAMTNSERRVLNKIKELGKVLSTELPDKVRLSPRTVSFAIRRLLEKGLVKRTPNLEDMRVVWYSPVDEPTVTDGCNDAVVLTQPITG